MATAPAVIEIEAHFRRLLARGTEAVASGDLEPARLALEEALAIRSRDPQVLGLLGQVFYRLARYQDAATAWQRLVDDNPVEPGARVNLGLAWLKARRFEAAIKQLRIALDLNPEHRKAAGYLGLAWLEEGRPEMAREWFHKAGSDQMVARCDELLALAAAPPEPPQLPPEGPSADPVPLPVPGQVARTAEAQLDEVPIDEVAVEASPIGERPVEPAAAGPTPAPADAAAVEDEPATPPQVSVETALDAAADAFGAPRSAGPDEEGGTPAATAALLADPADPAGLPTLAGFAAARAVQGPAGQVFVAEGATLTVNVHGELLCRLAGLAAWRGELAFAGEVKRFRGRATDTPFGEPPEQMHRLVGDGLVVLRAAGRRFTVLELGGEAGYFREAVVFGFQEQVAFENGRLPSPLGGLDLIHLRGRGRLVLVTHGEPVAVEVTPASPVHVPLSSLVGWTGALTPRIAPLFAGGTEGEALEISGEGRVLVDPGHTARHGEGT